MVVIGKVLKIELEVFFIITAYVRRWSDEEKYNCPNCGQGNGAFKNIAETVTDIYRKKHKVDVLVGVCDRCEEKIYPKESAMMIERIKKPHIYSLELPTEIVDKLIISAKEKGKDFRKYALEKLAEWYFIKSLAQLFPRHLLVG